MKSESSFIPIVPPLKEFTFALSTTIMRNPANKNEPDKKAIFVNILVLKRMINDEMIIIMHIINENDPNIPLRLKFVFLEIPEKYLFLRYVSSIIKITNKEKTS